MNEQNYNVLGVMSGTSLDGVDLAHISLTLQDGEWSYIIHEAQTISYSEEWVKRLQAAIDFDADALAGRCLLSCRIFFSVCFIFNNQLFRIWY